mmetsp:Transcript_11242/g.19659  ORF Transcript_11242/g.19659 Transcript_11242/m.19659 type:complete len:250 (+) Transcript_11242:630-1379(+)
MVMGDGVAGGELAAGGAAGGLGGGRAGASVRVELKELLAAAIRLLEGPQQNRQEGVGNRLVRGRGADGLGLGDELSEQLGGGEDEGRSVLLVHDAYVGAGFNQHHAELLVVRVGGPVEGGVAALVLDIHVGAVSKEDADDLEPLFVKVLRLPGNVQQRRIAVLVNHVGVGAPGAQQLDHFSLQLARRRVQRRDALDHMGADVDAGVNAIGGGVDVPSGSREAQDLLKHGQLVRHVLAGLLALADEDRLL